MCMSFDRRQSGMAVPQEPRLCTPDPAGPRCGVCALYSANRWVVSTTQRGLETASGGPVMQRSLQPWQFIVLLDGPCAARHSQS